MPVQKDLKRLVRSRMRKTGESYTAARAILVARRAEPTPAASTTVATAAAAPAPADFARLAGMSDAAVKKATGCDWAKWVKALDYHGAATMSHQEIARMVAARYHTSSWWSQTVTVGYERIRGRREKGQRCTGSYGMDKSLTVAVPVAALYAAFLPPQLWQWLGDDARPELRKCITNRSVRMKWPDGTTVAVGFASKGPSRSQAQLSHEGLAAKADAARMRAWWTGRLTALRAHLGAG